MSEDELRFIANRGLSIVQIRLEALKSAIDAQDWERTRWHYDRVARSVAKTKRNLNMEEK